MRRMLFASLCLSTPALAQTTASTETLLPDIVVTATRVPTLSEQIPAGVSLIDRETIERRGYATLADALQSVPGLSLVQAGGVGGQTSVFVRGTNSDHVLVLRDGVPVNDPSNPAGSFDFGPDGLVGVERIEVIRGPMSGLYGSGAIGGVVNLISRTGRSAPDAAPHGSAALGFGLPRQTTASADVAGRAGALDYALQAGLNGDVGFDTTPRRMTYHTGSRNSFNAKTVSVNLGYTPIDGTRVFIAARQRLAAGNLDTLGFDPRRYTETDDAASGQLGVTSALFDGRLETSLIASALRGDRHYREPLEAGDPNANQGDSKYRATRTGVQWNTVLHLPDMGPATSGALTLGAEHRRDAIRVAQNVSSYGYPYQQTTVASAVSNALSLGGQTRLFRRLTLTAGAREEDARYGGSAFTWRAGGVLTIDEIASLVKASYGTAFRAPSLYDLFGVDSYSFHGNPNLRPERSQGYELGWAVDVPVFGDQQGAVLDVTYFNSRIRDLIQAQYAADYSSSTEINIGRARTEGFETSLTLHPASWVEAMVSYTYTEARNVSNNSRLLRRPKNRFTLNTSMTPRERLRISAEIVAIGAFQDYLVDSSGASTRVGRAPSGTIVNLTATYDITPQLTVFTAARNVGGSRFEAAQGFQTPGPSVMAGLRARF